MKCSASYTITVLADGTDGVSVASITAYYAISSTSDKAPTEGWDTNPQTLTPFYRFLWYKEVTTYSDGHSDPETTPIIIGVYGEGAVGVILSSYSWMFSADEFGVVPNSEYEKFKVDVSVVKGGKSLDFDMLITETGITGASISGNSIILSSDSVMEEDSASIKVIATVNEVSYEATITLAKAKQASSKPMYFAWSKNETIFTPKDSNFWILGSSFIFMNKGMIGNIPYQSDWIDDRAKVMKYKTKEYKYLWCKLEEDSEPFLFTGETGETGTYLSFDVSQTEVDCYIDGPLVSDEDITITAESDLPIKLLIGNKVVSSESTKISYIAKASEILCSETYVTITASTEKMSKSYVIKKKYLSLYFDTTISSAQFSYDSENNPSPAFIAIVNNTSGLSDKNLVKLTVGGEEKSWENGIFSLTPDMIIGRYINIVLSYGDKSSSLLISKTYDGKVEIIEYAVNKDPDNHPEGFGLEFAAQTFAFNEQLFQWGDPWSSELPKVTSGEYLWRRSRMSDSDVWNYVRMTGEKGERGEDGKAGEYLGHYTSAPTKKANGSEITSGDFYLNTSQEGSPKPYKYVSGQWILITSDSEEWSQIAAATLDDVNNYGGSLLSSSAYYGYFQALASQTAFIKSLGAEEMTLNDGGVIQSENYKSTSGAEGFKIDSEGNVDFNEGTWRGSFANGLSFIPPTNLSVKKTMTHKEVYQMMKKAGIVKGVYQLSDPVNFVPTGRDTRNGELWRSMGSSATGLNITEYTSDSLTCSIPIGAMEFSGIIPLYTDIFLGFSINTTTKTSSDDSGNTTVTHSITSKKAYLFTKSELIRNFAQEEFYTVSSEIQAHEIDISNWLISGFLDSDGGVVAMYGTSVGHKFLVLNTDNLYNIYSVDRESMTLVLDGTVSFTDWIIGRWIFPAYYFHKSSDNYYQVPLLDKNYTQFKFSKTLDLLNYTDVDGPYTFIYPEGYNTYIPLDIIKVGSRIFAQILESNSNNLTRYYFAEYNNSTQKFEQIPDDYTCVEGVDSLQLVPLCEKDGLIVGSFSGLDLFSYNTSTNTYTDLSDIFDSALPYVNVCDNGGGTYESWRTFSTTIRKRCRRSDDSDSSKIKWSLIFYNPDIYINTIQYSDKFSCFLISATFKGKDGLYDLSSKAVYKYYPSGKIEMMSPMVGAIQNIPNVCSYIEDDNGEYSLANGCYVFTSYVDFSDFVNITINNFSVGDYIKYYNGDKTVEELMGYSGTLPSWLSFEHGGYMTPSIVSDSLGLGSKQYYTRNDLKLYQSKDTSITYNFPIPFLAMNRIAVRETPDSYEVVSLAYIWYLTTHYYGNPIHNLFMRPVAEGTYNILGDGESIEPIFVIKKNSDEPLGVSFYWDFPAQFTVDENIKEVVRSDLFIDNFTIKIGE